ncbi:energy transducer TonB [Geomonas edaphica]|uniref:energy transducer TonB n=1 Tax=Geomonas edaphica TaxID=2570226 RepID=UPI0010A90374|nr:energy transducer TonB [Geomonas edaphica]
MSPLRAETLPVAPLLLLSFLVHLFLLYGAGRLWQREGVREERNRQAVVAYLDLGGAEKAPAPGRATFPVSPVPLARRAAPAAMPPVVGPSATASRTEPVSPAAPPRTSASPVVPVVGAPAGALHPAAGSGCAAAGATIEADNRGMGSGRGPFAAPAAAPASSGQGAGREVRGGYQALLKRLVEAHKEYPLAARKSGREGSCRRRFMLRRDGSLKSVEPVDSCGHPFLDAAATRAISSVGAFPPVPAELSPDEPFEVTITFALARK